MGIHSHQPTTPEPSGARRFFSGLRFRLLALVLIGVIPSLALILYTAAEQRRFATEEVQSGALRLAYQAAADHQRMVDETRQLLVTLSYLPAVGDPSACNQVFAELLSQYPQYINLGLVNLDGSLLCNALHPGSTINLAQTPFMQRAIAGGGFVSGGYQFDPLANVPDIIFALPVFSESDEIQSVVFAALNLDWLNQLVFAAQLPDDAVLLVMDNNRTVLVYHPDNQEWAGKRVTGSLVSTMLTRGEGTAELPGLDGQNRLYAFTYLQGWQAESLHIGVGISPAAAFARVDQALYRHLAGLSIVFSLALAAAWIGGDLFVVRRVKVLVQTARRLAAGDLSARTGLTYGHGELSQLARTFDHMGAVLEQRESERQANEEEIKRHLRDLSALNDITAAVSSSLHILEVLESLKRLLSEQFHVPAGAVYSYDENQRRLSLEVAWGVPPAVLANFKEMPADSFHYAVVIELRKPYLNPDICQVEPYASAGLADSRPNLKNHLCIPLTATGQIQGVIDMFSLASDAFTTEQVHLFATMGQEVGVAIQNAHYFAEVNASRERLRLLSQQLIEVQENERRHIARELHDEIGQALTALKVNLQTVSRIVIEPDLLPQLHESIAIIDRTIKQVRNLSLDLRPSLLDDLGVVSALRWYIDRQAQRTGIETFFTAHPPDMRFSPALETTCFRVVQEALTNVVRHARAQRVSVSIVKHDQYLEVIVRDDGVGFDLTTIVKQPAAEAALGLMGMKERVELVGGSLEILSDHNHGTEIRACLPLE
jgi:signal transduction histidine kinase